MGAGVVSAAVGGTGCTVHCIIIIIIVRTEVDL